MCGIVGLWSPLKEPPPRELLTELVPLLDHRGPDDSGVWLKPGVALGHTRLSIIDIEGGSQPFTAQHAENPLESTTLVYNGELYNYQELRQSALQRGVEFKTASDTEVFLKEWQQRGMSAFEQFNGQFAAAIYSSDSHELVLARDGMGEKPLYYARIGGWVCFGSELKVFPPIFAYLGVSPGISTPALKQYLALNYIPSDATLLQGVHKVPPGHVLRFSPATSAGELIPFDPARTLSVDLSLQGLKTALVDALALRLRSDRPVGMFLSGGIDSSLLTALLATSNTPIKAYIADFAAPAFSESSRATQLCRFFGIPCTRVRIDPHPRQIPELVSKLVDHGDEPLADSSALPVFLLSAEVSKEVQVALSGDGADELFGGYLTHVATMRTRALPSRWGSRFQPVLPIIRRLVQSNRKVGFVEKLERFVSALPLSPGARHFAWNGMWPTFAGESVLSKDLGSFSPEEVFEALALQHGLTHDITPAKMLLADQRTYLANDILPKVDRMSMAHGLEVRPVYLDPRIVKWTRETSAQYSRNASPPKMILGKQPLRQLLAQSYPGYQFSSKKGFSIPVHLWFRTVLKEFADDLFMSSSLEQIGLFNTGVVRALWRQHLSRERSLGFELWGIMMLVLWHRRFLGR